MLSMSDLKENLPPIEREMEVLTKETVDSFAGATFSEHFQTMPPSLATRFRKAEFEWLEKMKVDMRTLLHVEQEYEFLSPLTVGDAIRVSTKIASWRERRGMTFVTLVTDIFGGKELKVRSHTNFLLQNNGAK